MRLAANLPRTVLSASNAAESPTALLARREMQSWRLLQLEPSALRQPDNFKAPAQLGMDGSHMAATLYHLAHFNPLPQSNGVLANAWAEQIYGQVANNLAELIDDVQRVWIDRDDQRELLTLHVTGHDNTSPRPEPFLLAPCAFWPWPCWNSILKHVACSALKSQTMGFVPVVFQPCSTSFRPLPLTRVSPSV